MESNELPQVELPLNRPAETADISRVLALPSFSSAIKLCATLSGKQAAQICDALKMDSGHWSRVLSNKAHFPHEKLVNFMEYCGNMVPLMWLHHHCGLDWSSVRPLQTETEKELARTQAALAERDNELNVIKKFLKETRV